MFKLGESMIYPITVSIMFIYSRYVSRIGYFWAMFPKILLLSFLDIDWSKLTSREVDKLLSEYWTFPINT